MNSAAYWERRQAQNMHDRMDEADKTADQISVLYARAAAYLDGEADRIFERYRMKHGLTKAEAMRLLDAMHDKTSLNELLAGLRAGDERQRELLAQLEGAAYGARLARLAHLRRQLDAIMAGVYEQELRISAAHYINLAGDAYYRTIYDMQRRVGAAFSFSAIRAKTIDKAVHSKWSGKNYSDRIWDNTQALADRVKKELLVNLVTGRTNREASDAIAKEFARGASDARRLVWTESAYLSAEIDFQAYEEMGVEKYQYLATLDLKTCENCCRELDGKVFPVRDRKTGENCPPMHPWCRCTTVSAVPDGLREKLKRRARDPVSGKNVLVPMTMTYQEWHDKYVKGNPDAEFEEKKAKALSVDKAQYEKYKKALGRENIPKTLDEFQNMKYTESEKWREAKAAYKDVNWQRQALKNHKSGEVHSPPFKGEPNSVFDNYKDGRPFQRRYYGKTGKPRLDIDLTDHGNAKEHPVVPHYHDWNEVEGGAVKRDSRHDQELKLGHRIANKDIL